MPRFFIAGTNIKGGMAVMKGRDAEHARVLRLRPGDDVIICDGEGTDYKCHVVLADKDEVQAQVIEVKPCTSEPSVKVTLLCGIPKGPERVEYIIQKGVEAGASEIRFFQSRYCVARPETPEKKLERWQRIAEEAAKQSGRGIIPAVGWEGELADAFNTALSKDLGLFMYETGERESLASVLELNKNIGSAAIITGPEGGFAEFEADLARIVGLHVCSMGERILRCETAPIVALSALMYSTGNLA